MGHVCSDSWSILSLSVLLRTILRIVETFVRNVVSFSSLGEKLVPQQMAMNSTKALEELSKISQGTFTDTELQQMISYALTLSAEAGATYFKGIVGESALMNHFCQSWIEFRNPPSRQAPAWTPKRTGFDLLLEIAEDLYSIDELKEINNHAKSLDYKERELYFKSLLGEGEKVDRMLLLMQKQAEKEQSRMANQPKAEAKKSKKKNEILNKVGNAPKSKIGREICECMATVHSLVTNCLECGKIVCAFEGYETCPECNADLKTYTTLVVSEALHIAQERQKTLLEYDSSSAKRTQVIDVAADFDYQSEINNRWLTADQRQLALDKQKELESKQEQAKKSRVITLDLENRKVVAEKTELTFKKESFGEKSQFENEPTLRNPNLKVEAPEYKPTMKLSRQDVSIKKPNVALQDLLDEDLGDVEFSPNSIAT